MARTLPCTVIPRSVNQTILALSVLVCAPALAWYQAVETVAIGNEIEQGGSPAQNQTDRPERATSAPDRARAEATKPSSAEPARSKTDKTRVFQVYRDSCIECHDGDGRGESNRDIYGKIPDFTNPAWQSSRNDARIKPLHSRGQREIDAADEGESRFGRSDADGGTRPGIPGKKARHRG